MNLNSGAEKEKKEIRGLNIKWFFLSALHRVVAVAA